MTKQEQSEKIIYGSLITSTKCYNCIHFPLCFAQKSGVNLGLASENDCCYYQSKLPEDSVVLSREEYEDYKKHVDNCIEEYYRGQHEAEVYYKNIQISRERKETAEKILNDLVKNCQYTFNIDGKPIVELDGDFVLNAAKSYGIKIKE